MAVSPLALGVILTVVSLCDAVEKLYDIIPEKTDPGMSNPDYAIVKTFEVSKFNRTSYCINAEFEFTQDFPEDATCSVDLYEKYGNRYGKSAISIPEVNCCKFFKTDVFVMPSMKAMNFLGDCPLKKGTQKLDQWYPDTENWPDVMPGEYWRADLNAKTADGEDIIRNIALFFKVDNTKGFKLG